MSRCACWAGVLAFMSFSSSSSHEQASVLVFLPPGTSTPAQQALDRSSSESLLRVPRVLVSPRSASKTKLLGVLTASFVTAYGCTRRRPRGRATSSEATGHWIQMVYGVVRTKSKPYGVVRKPYGVVRKPYGVVRTKSVSRMQLMSSEKDETAVWYEIFTNLSSMSFL